MARKASKKSRTTSKNKTQTAKKKASKSKSATKKKVAKKASPKKTSKKQAKPVAKKKSSAPKGNSKKALKVEKVEEEKPPRETFMPTMAELKIFKKAAEKREKLKRSIKRSKRATSFLAKPPKSGKPYTLDLRIHSPASIGYFSMGGVEPVNAIVRLAQVKGLDVVAVTDHYNAKNIDEIKQQAENSKVTVIPGLGIRVRVGELSEVELLALFPESFGSVELFDILDELEVPKSAYGHRDYVIEKDIQEVLAIVESKGGCLIPSRIDKTPYRQLAIQTLVEGHGFHAFDLVHPDEPEYFRDNWPDGEFTFFAFSNALALGQVGSRTVRVKLESPGFLGIKSLVERRTGE